MMPMDQCDGSSSPRPANARSPSPGEKRSASEITDPDTEGGVSTTVDFMAADTIDDQISKVIALANEPLKDGQKGYVVSSRWVKTLYARSTAYADQADKEAMSSELGPVDNRDVVLDTDPANSNFKYESGDAYVPLRPNLTLGVDYEIVPEEAWQLIMKEYGLAPQSPVIVRFAHNASMDDSENVMYELNPPIFTIFKLANPAAATTPQSLKEKTRPPVRMLAGRQSGIQAWLKRAKELAGIDLSTKVRVWKIIGQLPSLNPSTSTTPAVSRAVSRAVSPAPPTALISASSRNLLVDLNTFLDLNEGTQRELLETFKDQTSNGNYNGKMTLSMAGLMGSDVFVLEEQVGTKSGEWVSSVSAEKLKRLGIPITKTMKESTSSGAEVTKSQTASGCTSPVTDDSPFGKKPSGHRLGVTGLSNLGNTCYQNAATQCVRAVEELTYYFLANRHKKDLNPSNPLGYSGQLAKAYAGLIQGIYRDPPPASFNPSKFRNQIGRNNPTMAGWEQQDSQEFLMFLLDGLSEDLNRILKKPYIEKPDSTDDMVTDRKALEDFAVRNWDIYKARNDSVVTDLFAGMYKSTLVCPSCDKVSIIFDPFSSLTLPIPQQKLEFRNVVFQALDKPPRMFTAEVDKTGTMATWKEAMAKKLNLNPNQLIAAEVDNGHFWEVWTRLKVPYEDLHLTPKDVMTFIELDEAAEDRILVPVFSRTKAKHAKGHAKYETFAQPTILSFTREESKDMATIYRKILRHVATMTTQDIMGEADFRAKKKALYQDADQPVEDSDAVLMNEEDANSGDSQIQTGSVEGEDGIVDISVQNGSRTPSAASPKATDTTADTPAHPLSGIIPSGLLSLFEVKVMPSGERMPKGRQINGSAEKILSRLPSSKKAAKKNSSRGSDEDTNASTSASDDSEQESGRLTSSRPLLKQSDSIILDWNEDAKDALFGKSGPEDHLRGAATCDQMPFTHDQGVIDRRAQRDARATQGVSLDQCLDEFSREETLSEDDAWYCPRCKAHRQASKKFELWTTPDILVIHLKRFTTQSRYARAKLGTKVDFPVENLDLSPWVTGPTGDKSLVYDLIGVDNHSGSMSGGHYTAYAKNFITDDWCSFNDSSASIIRDLGRMQSPQAYLLFYRRRSDKPLGGPVLQNIITKFKTGENDSTAENSRSSSPLGDGKRLGGSSRNGSSRASVRRGASRQVDGGGSGPATPETKSSDDEHDVSNPLDDMFSGPSWSFERPGESSLALGPLTSVRPVSPEDDQGLFEDNDSNVAVDEGSDAEERLHGLGNSRQVSDHEGSFEDVPTMMDEGSDDDLPVVELRVDSDEKAHSEA
ncbi:Ubiquitin carboxyl-terminal hydrolase [Penicillium ucsense]|uniref:ubiquitinyl hydrolase 1 n=1 Tax=Penicillium ucsense TaxID=2839758 RepID=A0A8J8WAN5_9EURO|nr:Ubiquitin carboxyl-terminal hydrolase [Penicillium ucsense]KAF7738780.1 Ubiquitin carboxyl-terminal hydrolase [Penicillium ucsense]